MAGNRPTDEDFLVGIESALEANLLPEPGLEVLQRTRDAVLEAVVPLVAQLRHAPAVPGAVPSAAADRAGRTEAVA